MAQGTHLAALFHKCSKAIGVSTSCHMHHVNIDSHVASLCLPKAGQHVSIGDNVQGTRLGLLHLLAGPRL